MNKVIGENLIRGPLSQGRKRTLNDYRAAYKLLLVRGYFGECSLKEEKEGTMKEAVVLLTGCPTRDSAEARGW